ncbi:hypothetical protein ACFWZA_29245 [[Kitasatospora] papulosa]|uniref:hypothetical protein n=1 Tax=Streptomyces TaxID=1883 RepID=UPI0034206D23
MITGTSPRPTGLARITAAATRVRGVVSETRAMARERRHALDHFHDGLGLRPGASVQDVLDAISELRGRRLQPVELDLIKPSVSGVSVLASDDNDVDLIGISSRISRRHRTHVLLHEIRHLSPGGDAFEEDRSARCIAVHPDFDGVTLESLYEQMSGLPEKVRQELLTRPVKLRARYEHPEERACEVFARVVLPLLDLDATTQLTGSIASAFSNRRSL